jgi:5-methyltetrahydropteroyltriglutamate--homocysteine methyltransferase
VLEARTDVVGSLLRPPELLDARERLARGELTAPQFKRIEDDAVDAALRKQEEAGLDVVTDGELRRLSFQSALVEDVEGFGEWDLNAFLWGRWRSEELGDVTVERPALAVTGKLRRKRFSAVEELAYARGRTDRVLKVTLPSPTLYAQFWDPERSRAAYPTLESFLDDVAILMREEVGELVRLGASYIQIDAPHYPLLIDPRYREVYESRGWPAEERLEFGLRYDDALMEGQPAHVTFGFHLCRGNQMSRWLVEGGYDWLAERLFPRIRAQRLLLEYDDERSGSFEPLRLVPEDKIVVLGLVTTKTGRRETVGELVERIEQATAHVPLERLALSPQCGFATSVEGNALTPEDQWAKLRTIVETARAVWP